MTAIAPSTASTASTAGLAPQRNLLREQIETLDLDPIKIKIMDENEGGGWTRRQVDTVEREYKRFLFLVGKFPTLPIVPTKTVDTMWHYHILDTRKYAEDCERIFGRFVHHFPYFGMRDESDARELQEAYKMSAGLYETEFGQPSLIGLPQNTADCSTPGSCNAKCDVVPACKETPDCRSFSESEKAVRPSFAVPSQRTDLYAEVERLN